MLSIIDIKEKAQMVSSPLPIFWVAQYKDGYENLKVPKCNKCNNYVKVFDYKNIVCQATVNGKKCCEDKDFTWESFSLNDGLFMEYDENGQETLKFSFLPLDRLEAFYIYVKPKEQIFGFNMKDGEFNIDGITLGAGTVINKQLLAVSNQIPYYGRGLFHFRSALSGVGRGSNLIWYKVGYTYSSQYADTVTMLAIHIPTLNPYIFSECYPK